MNRLFKSSKGKESTNTDVISNKRILTVEVIEAKQIKACHKNATSDPFGKICLINSTSDKEIANESFKLSKKSGTVDPVWNEKFEFGHKYELTNPEYMPNLNITLYHKGYMDPSEKSLGKIEVTLNDISVNVVDKWYTIKPDGRADKISGEIHLRLSFNKDIETEEEDNEDQECEDTQVDEQTSLLIDQEESDDLTATVDSDPNTLDIFLIRARNLAAMDKTFLMGKTTSSDPFVRFRIPGFSDQVSAVKEKNLNPEWREHFRFEGVTNSSLSLDVSVYDKDKISKKFIGKVFLKVTDFTNKSKKWYTLLSKSGASSTTELGEIELEIHWYWDPKVAAVLREKKFKIDNKISTKIFKTINSFTGNVEDAENDEMEYDDGPSDEVPPENPEEKKKKEEEIATKTKELSEIDIKSGDYQVLVHIIEARDLKAENIDNTSDPIVYIHCLEQKQSTKVIRGVTNCVFDDLHIFNFPNLDKESFNEGFIRCEVRDAMTITVPGFKGTMIGAYTIDAAQVYQMNKDHEFYRQWVPLMDDEEASDTGVQGFLKITIQIIGPGEKVKVHDEDADRAKEIEAESKAGNDVSSLVASVPMIRKEWKYLVVNIYRLEGLPVMDGKQVGGIVGAKTDAFCELAFAGGRPLKTKIVTVSGDSRLAINPHFNAQLWYPVSYPTMTQVIKIGVYDDDSSRIGPEIKELIGFIMEKMNNVCKKSGKSEIPPRWYNIYGAPEFKQAKAAENLIKGVKEISRVVNKTLIGSVDWYSYYNNVPEKASSYKGRALLAFKVVSEDQKPKRKDAKSSKDKEPEVAPFRMKIKSLKIEPKTKKYVLQALVICGTDLPAMSEIPKVSYHNLSVVISMGVFDKPSNGAQFKEGLCTWNQFIKTPPLEFPQDLEQIPDIFVYLVKTSSPNKPLSFARIKPVVGKDKNMKTIGFLRPAEWVLLQEDKSIDALETGQFPGSILIKLGFGLESESKSVEADWNKLLDEEVKHKNSYQMRVHVFQAANLPSADNNGLSDPFVKVYYNGEHHKVDYVRKTLFPSWNQTVLFNDVTIPVNFDYAPQVVFKVYDHNDLSPNHTYLGTFAVQLKDAEITEDENILPQNLKDPKWYNIFKEVPNDTHGKVLVSIQLIPQTFRKVMNTKKENLPSIVPDTCKAYIELIALGIRDLEPFNFQAMQAPFLELELNSFGTIYLSSTGISKKPNPSNPNFLEKITMEVKLPLKSIYATSLQIRARDTRLGGFLKPVVGVGVIDLSSKLPWCEDTYIEPQKDNFTPVETIGGDIPIEATENTIPGTNTDEISMKVKELRNKKEDILSDKFIATAEPLPLTDLIHARTKEEDSGAGVFGALNHINLSKKVQKKEIEYADLTVEEEEKDSPPAWKVGRKILDSELENELVTTPFETYPLYRGKENGLFGSTLKVVGLFKGILRVKRNKDDPELFEKSMLDNLLKPKPYKVRIYVLRASNLAQMDTDFFGNKSNSDPYLKLTLGKFKYSDRENAVDDVMEIDIYKMIEVDVELPGTSQLVLEVMDKDLIGKDDLIGRTTIDLEDRWFDNRWQELGKENQTLPTLPSTKKDDENDKDNKTKNVARWKTKPIERRTLYQPHQSIGQGIIECFVDIMKPEEASIYPPDDIHLPPKQIFEVRLVIWKTKDVPAMDSFEGMSDLFVKAWIEGTKPQETDTHWRCKRGKASFNWRLLFDVELSQNSRAMKFPYLHVQLWDRDIVKWNDCAGESIMDLGKYFRRAFRKNETIKLFVKKQGAAARREKQQANIARQDPSLLDNPLEIPPEEPVAKVKPTVNPVTNVTNSPSDIQSNSNPLTKESSNDTPITSIVDAPAIANNSNDPLNTQVERAPDSDDEDDNGVGVSSLSKRTTNTLKSKTLPNSSKYNDIESNKKSTKSADKKVIKKDNKIAEKKSWFSNFNIFSSSKDDDKDKKKDDDKKKKEDDDDNEELKSLISTFKGLTGLWDEDPPDSDWLKISSRDHNTDKVKPMGQICFSLEIWPKEKALQMPVGAARSDPNTNPYLPPPVGRLRFSWNPFVLGSELCGPALCAQLFCCLICIGFVLLMVFAQPFLTLMINILFFFA